MNGELLIGLGIFVLLGTISVALLMGKGAFLISGYNTSSKEEKLRYNEKKLCTVMGWGLSFITLIVGVNLYFGGVAPSKVIQFLMPAGIVGTTIVMVILANTICKKK